MERVPDLQRRTDQRTLGEPLDLEDPVSDALDHPPTRIVVEFGEGPDNGGRPLREFGDRHLGKQRVQRRKRARRAGKVAGQRRHAVLDRLCDAIG